jgi:hypothetical protein
MGIVGGYGAHDPVDWPGNSAELAACGGNSAERK